MQRKIVIPSTARLEVEPRRRRSPRGKLGGEVGEAAERVAVAQYELRVSAYDVGECTEVLMSRPFPRLREKPVQEHGDSQYFRNSLVVTHIVYILSNGGSKYSLELRKGYLALLLRDFEVSEFFFS